MRIDKLTGLKNRDEFFYNGGNKKTILFIDLNKFKPINDIYGHRYGDEVLKEIGNRLQIIEDQKINVYRFGGDEFLIETDETDKNKILELSTLVNSLISKDFLIDGYIFNVGSSIGISLNNSVEEADMAMYESKKNNVFFAFFNPSIKEKLEQSFFGTELIKYALSNDAFTHEFQPIVDKNGKIVSVETLLRIKKDGKIYSPFYFIDVLEEMEQVIEVGYLSIKEAFLMSKDFLEKKGIKISVNISEKQIDSIDFMGNIIKLLKETGTDPKFIKFEILERNSKKETDIAKFNIQMLIKKGFNISIDDFGDECSSFFRTDSYDISEVKLDKSFVDRLFIENKNSQNSIQALVTYAKLLKINLICEGIETKEEADKLFQLGVDYIQGYYFYKPMSKENLITLL